MCTPPCPVLPAMRLTSLFLGHFIPYKRVPGSLWAGKQRKIPRLTASRKAAFMDELLLTQQNERYLSRPFLSQEAEATTLPAEKAKELARENEVFYKIYEEKFRIRFPDRKLEDFCLPPTSNPILVEDSDPYSYSFFITRIIKP
ncbi:expressed conserved protein [Echinococcus multilocularis]|uniref:Expressed conserved protein n=1 Tax=Echinococcus multilocularis TaxID=6211 RepID=A0A068Y364_ECHMU|nr:expressed conserved protein [Echinococcus multilocularis]